MVNLAGVVCRLPGRKAFGAALTVTVETVEIHGALSSERGERGLHQSWTLLFLPLPAGQDGLVGQGREGPVEEEAIRTTLPETNPLLSFRLLMRGC